MCGQMTDLRFVAFPNEAPNQHTCEGADGSQITDDNLLCSRYFVIFSKARFPRLGYVCLQCFCIANLKV
jgi:hypothetical protein